MDGRVKSRRAAAVGEAAPRQPAIGSGACCAQAAMDRESDRTGRRETPIVQRQLFLRRQE